MEPLLLSPKARPFPSICRKTAQTINHDMIAPRETHPSRRGLARYPTFFMSTPNVEGLKCPPVSPVSHFNPFSDCKNFGFYETKKNLVRKKKNKNKKTMTRSSSLYSASHNGGCWYSSEDGTETLFSSRSTFSSHSSQPRRRRRHCRRPRYRLPAKGEMGYFPVEGRSKVKDSFAVVKRSSDPYNDFMTSMVEMIVERQMFAAKDLEQLLQCFLSLNSHHHHSTIVEVFAEILEALSSSRS
ncbi:hypothetical protein SLEP1_g22989 [Rubroshorea leprosula]|uniref:Transcription repressor n=1 Tax=Rubroshorea leprosula TaxID=152421 RepID=A0AAV5JG91_9ROSI|nr:hypothetical protein SLEP1_g22989 [Rubroshorea leprosula]